MILFWILLALACLCFGVAAARVTVPRVDFTALGLLLAALAELGRSLAHG